MGSSKDTIWLRRAAILAQIAAAAAGIGAGLGHTLSIMGKIRVWELEAVQSPPVLFLVGALLVLAGMGAGWGALGLFRTGRPQPALIGAGVLLVTVLAISVVFSEFRGLPLAIAPVLALAASLIYGRAVSDAAAAAP